MNAEVNVVPDSGPEAAPTVAARTDATRPFYWSVRRELWEHRSLVIAPLVPAGIVLLFMLLAAFNLTSGVHFTAPTDPSELKGPLLGMLAMPAFIIMTVAAVTAFFYCLDALYSERRDRSILFWKSLPVSDITAVLSKLFVPMVAVPVIVLAVVLATSLVMLLIATGVLLAHGANGLWVWTTVPLFQVLLWLVYVLIASALWYAPVYAWLLLVSAWARRSTFLWAVMPPLAIGLVERLAFGTTYFWAMLRSRMEGVADALAGTAVKGMGRSMTAQFRDGFDPSAFLTNPAVWIGLVVAAGLIAAAVWMRRYREPL